SILGRADKGFTSLFNRKDLSGWKLRSATPGHWRLWAGLTESALQAGRAEEFGQFVFSRILTRPKLLGEPGCFFCRERRNARLFVVDAALVARTFVDCPAHGLQVETDVRIGRRQWHRNRRQRLLQLTRPATAQ